MTRTLRVSSGQLLLLAAALAASLAAIVAVTSLDIRAPSDGLMVEAWRAFGLGVFAGLFGLLAWRPHALPGVWELLIAHKVAMTLIAASASEAAEADTIVVADGSLTLVLVVAYVLLRADRAWRTVVARTRDGQPEAGDSRSVRLRDRPSVNPVTARHRTPGRPVRRGEDLPSVSRSRSSTPPTIEHDTEEDP